MLELLFAYLAGLLTLINPCVIPVLPIVLASAARGTKSGPIALALGMGLSFVTLGMIVATIGNSIGLTEHVLSRVGAVLMMGFGLILVIPAFPEFVGFVGLSGVFLFNFRPWLPGGQSSAPNGN